jgi:Tol biopolymer transport system component
MLHRVGAVAMLVIAFGGEVGCGGNANPVDGRASDGLVFSRLVDGIEDLVRARLSDGAEAPLSKTSNRRERWPVWSENANALSYEVQELAPNARSDLALWNAADGTETKLTSTPVRRETWASWSPKGRQLAYAFRGGSPTGGPSGGIALRDLDAESAVPVVRVGEEAAYIRPHFDPSGRRIMVQRKAPRGGSHLWIVGLRQKPRPVTRDAEWFDLKGFFTRTGDRIVYTRRLATGGSHQIVSVDLRGEDLRVLAESDGASDDHSARPSPTRDEVVFVSDRGGAPDLYRADLGGGSPRRLTRTPDESEFAPRWSPDGERIVATVTPLALGRPRVVDPEGLEQARVIVFDRDGQLLFEAPGFMPEWMPPWR